METLFILTNSPGELSGWLAPVAEAVASEAPEVRINAVTLPCPYASGMERETALRLRGVSAAGTFSDAMKGGAPRGRSIILQLGGDPMFGWTLSRRLGAPWTAYTARPRWRGSVAHYFIPDEGAYVRFKNAGVSEDRLTLTGNLMLDSVPERSSCDICGFRTATGITESRILCLMPGSRPFEYGQMTGFFSECAKLLYERFSSWQAVMPLAPTVDEKILCKGIENAGFEWTGKRFAEEIKTGNGRILLVRERRFDAIAASSLAVALPGTNNLQIASLGVPLLVIAPLNRAAEIPLDGIPGIIPAESAPARALKKRVVFHYNDREKFVSLPNRISGRSLVAERRELMTPESACRYIAEMMDDEEKRNDTAKGYAALGLERGASAKIAAKLIEMLKSR